MTQNAVARQHALREVALNSIRFHRDAFHHWLREEHRCGPADHITDWRRQHYRKAMYWLDVARNAETRH